MPWPTIPTVNVPVACPNPWIITVYSVPGWLQNVSVVRRFDAPPTQLSEPPRTQTGSVQLPTYTEMFVSKFAIAPAIVTSHVVIVTTLPFPINRKNALGEVEGMTQFPNAVSRVNPTVDPVTSSGVEERGATSSDWLHVLVAVIGQNADAPQTVPFP